MDAILQTGPDLTALIARIVLGAIILPHGAQKLLGWFGGFGYRGTMNFFTQNMHIPYVFGLLAILAEFVGGLGLVLGLFGRASALAVGAVMVVAVLTSHVQHGFFMNWLGSKKGEGYEFHLLALGLALIVLIAGSGAWSFDQILHAWLAGQA